MKAAVYDENGPPSVLRYADVPDPTCGPEEVLIEVAAVSIEGGDTLNRLRGALVTRPHIVGYQASGVILERGAAVRNLRVGDRVVTVAAFGSHAERRAVPARTAWRLPDGLDLACAAAIPIAFGTADDCLFEFGKLERGESVLIQAGASGVGVAAIQLAKRAGACVLATASSDDRLERLKPLGLDHGINYRTADPVAEVKRLTDGRGVDLVVDPVGGSMLPASLAAARYRGRVVLVGNAGRETLQADLSPLIGGNRALIGVYLAPEIATDRVHDNIQRLLSEAALGALEVVIDRRFPLAEAAEAHAYIESRRAVGRVLLLP